MSKVREIADRIIAKNFHNNMLTALKKGVITYDHDINNAVTLCVVLELEQKKYNIEFSQDRGYSVDELLRGYNIIGSLEPNDSGVPIHLTYAEYKNIPLILKALDAYADALPDNKLITPENINRLERIIDDIASFPYTQPCLFFVGDYPSKNNDIIFVKKSGEITIEKKPGAENHGNATKLENHILGKSLWHAIRHLNNDDLALLKSIRSLNNNNENLKNTDTLKKLQLINRLITYIDANELIADAFIKAYRYNNNCFDSILSTGRIIKTIGSHADVSLSKTIQSLPIADRMIIDAIEGIIVVPNVDLQLKWKLIPNIHKKEIDFDLSMSCGDIKNIASAIKKGIEGAPIQTDSNITYDPQNFFISVFKNANSASLSPTLLPLVLLHNLIYGTMDVNNTVKELKSLFVESVNNVIKNTINPQKFAKNSTKTTLVSSTLPTVIREYNKIMKNFRKSILSIFDEYKDASGVTFSESIQSDNHTVTVTYKKISLYDNILPVVTVLTNNTSFHLKYFITQNDFLDLQSDYNLLFSNVTIHQFENAIEQLERQIYTRIVSDKEEAADVLREHYPEEVMEYGLGMTVYQ
jgi:hypothetical protein